MLMSRLWSCVRSRPRRALDAFDGVVGALPLAGLVAFGGLGAERVGGVGDRVVEAVARDMSQRVVPGIAA